jgi:hypothetical protein
VSVMFGVAAGIALALYSKNAIIPICARLG